jgi:hypothetical protein
LFFSLYWPFLARLFSRSAQTQRNLAFFIYSERACLFADLCATFSCLVVRDRIRIIDHMDSPHCADDRVAPENDAETVSVATTRNFAAAGDDDLQQQQQQQQQQEHTQTGPFTSIAAGGLFGSYGAFGGETDNTYLDDGDEADDRDGNDADALSDGDFDLDLVIEGHMRALQDLAGQSTVHDGSPTAVDDADNYNNDDDGDYDGDIAGVVDARSGRDDDRATGASQVRVTLARPRPEDADEPSVTNKRSRIDVVDDAPPAPRRRGRPPGRTNALRRRIATAQRFVRDGADAIVREQCVARVARVRLDAMEPEVDTLDSNDVRLSTAADGSLPSALCFRRALDAAAEGRTYECMTLGCGRRFGCASQNALIGCTESSAPAVRDEQQQRAYISMDEDGGDPYDVCPTAESMPIEGFVCPLHGDQHAYCAACLLDHLQLDAPIATVDKHDYSHEDREATDRQLDGRWPVRCPGVAHIWLDTPPSVGTRALPRGGTVTTVDPSVMSASSIIRCPFVVGPQFAKALVERCPPQALRHALAATLGMAEVACAQGESIGFVPLGGDDDDDDDNRDDGQDDPDVYNRTSQEQEIEQDDATEAARARNSTARRAIRVTRQKGLARLAAIAEVEYRRRAKATNPQYWVSPCPYERCAVETHIDRERVFGIVCITCPGCKRLYCSGCRKMLSGCAPGEADEHTRACYDYRHAPWFSADDVHFLSHFLGDAATAAAAADPNRPPRPDTEWRRQAGAHTALDILLYTEGGAGVRRAIAARIAECLLRADENGSSQRCPTCHRRCNLAHKREPTRAAALEALGRARDSHDPHERKAAASHAKRLANVYATAVDSCACGTVWCYLCERVMPTSRAQHAAMKASLLDDLGGGCGMARADSMAAMAPYCALSADFDPPPAPVRECPNPLGSATPETTDTVDDAPLEMDAWRNERNRARLYWHEAPEYGPWRHTRDWPQHERSPLSRCDARERNDPLWARKWPACPPSMADLGDLRTNVGFVDARADRTTPSHWIARALAGRANLERFHAVKRHRLTSEVMRCVAAVPWIGTDMVDAIRAWLPPDVWQRAQSVDGSFCAMATACDRTLARVQHRAVPSPCSTRDFAETQTHDDGQQQRRAVDPCRPQLDPQQKAGQQLATYRPMTAPWPLADAVSPCNPLQIAASVVASGAVAGPSAQDLAPATLGTGVADFSWVDMLMNPAD